MMPRDPERSNSWPQCARAR